MSPLRLKNQTLAPRYIPKAVKHEQNLQLQVCRWLQLNYPNVNFRSDYASGLHLTKHQAIIHARLQSGRSWPDLFIYSMQRGYGGLGLELKKEGTAITVTKGPNKNHYVADPHIREQARLLINLRNEGYWADFAIGFDEAIEKIQWYFGVPKHERQKLF
jgi:hypothetical protein